MHPIPLRIQLLSALLLGAAEILASEGYGDSATLPRPHTPGRRWLPSVLHFLDENFYALLALSGCDDGPYTEEEAANAVWLAAVSSRATLFERDHANGPTKYGWDYEPRVFNGVM